MAKSEQFTFDEGDNKKKDMKMKNNLMKKNKFIDCITFFDNNFMFDIRYKTLENQIDYFVICEANFNHNGTKKKLKFDIKNFSFILFLDNA
mgnify:CR=1 FL=1